MEGGVFKMPSELPSFENFSKLKVHCRKLIHNPKDVGCIGDLKKIVEDSPETFIKIVQPTILATFFPILKKISEDKLSFSISEKQLIVDTLKVIFSKSTTDKETLFFNFYSFLLFEIYDHHQHKVLPIHEEYKCSIMECITALAQSLSSDIVFDLYTKENAPKLCQMLYVAIEQAKTEKMKNLRIAAIECIMSLARVLDDEDFEDTIVRSQVAEVFLFFLPGLASGLKQVALEDEKIGHKIPVVALRAWGRIITLLMQDYGVPSDVLDFSKVETGLKKNSSKLEFKINGTERKQKWKDNVEVEEYLKNNKITPEWYKDTDKQLNPLVAEFMKITHYSHPKVRLELCVACELIINNCLTTMPESCKHLIEIVIALTEDENDEISRRSNNILANLSAQLTSNNLKSLLEMLEEGFYNEINRLPRKFNSVDEREKLMSLNLLIGYLTLFGEHKLNHVLLSGNHLNQLLQTLIHISELKKSSTGLLEEYSVKDLDLSADSKSPWKSYCYFTEDTVQLKLEKLCNLLGKFETFRIVSDFLLDVLLYEPEHRKEAIFILNEVITGCSSTEENHQVIKDILTTYIDSSYWQVPLVVTEDEFGYEHTLSEVQHNVIQVCLLVEGVGKIAFVLGKQYKKFLFQTLYLILEKAGNNHSLVRAAGLSALKNVTTACGYRDITVLINENIDYFAYHVEKRLNRAGNKESVLNVLSVVLKYSRMDMLQYVGNIIEEMLVQSCDRFKEDYATAYLKVFKIFVHCLWKWLNIEIKTDPIKSKVQKLKEEEEFKVTGVETDKEDNLSEMEKSAEEMFEEDLKKKKEEDLKMEIEEPEEMEYKKPDPPMHIKLTAAVLARSLHFLPSKNRTRRLLVLEILTGGLEVMRDWEDELLPIVHQIWSPLVQRFKEFDDPLIINYSFQLLTTLARLSKEFITMRTTKEVLPSIQQLLENLSKESYLKDKGSAYRYTQNYKLQLIILENLGKVLVNLDVREDVLLNILDVIFRYTSAKQPAALQTASFECFKDIMAYDTNPVKNKLEMWMEKHKDDEFTKNLIDLNKAVEELKT